MADEDEDDVEDWTFEVQSVSRISPEPDDGEGPMFAVVFEAKGLSAEAEIEIFVADVLDPAQIIILAMDQLHRALSSWARITAGRRVANDAG
jgi:hypothetical protein